MLQKCLGALFGELPFGPTAVCRFAHRPHNPLGSAETAVGVDLMARAFNVDLHVQTGVAAKAKVFTSRYFNLIYAGAQLETPSVPDDMIAFADNDIRFAIVPPVKTKAHPPGPDALALNHRIGGHVEILDLNAIAAAAVAVFRQGFRRRLHQQRDQTPGK
jgi:hypothetical protein